MCARHSCVSRGGATTPIHPGDMASGIRAVRAPQGAPGSSGSVLLVDDEPLLLRALQRILRADGHRIALAESAEQAEEALAADPELDVVVLDLLLGRHSGLELLERLKRERP